MNDLEKRIRHIYNNWSLGSKGSSILKEAADALSLLEKELSNARRSHTLTLKVLDDTFEKLDAAENATKWRDIITYDLVPRRGEYYPPHVLCVHKEGKWIRMGRFDPILKRWYYSGTNERSQWAQVEGDEPTHWMHLPHIPKDGDN